MEVGLKPKVGDTKPSRLASVRYPQSPGRRRSCRVPNGCFGVFWLSGQSLREEARKGAEVARHERGSKPTTRVRAVG